MQAAREEDERGETPPVTTYAHSHAPALALRPIVTFLPLRASALSFLGVSSVVSPIHPYLDPYTITSAFGGLIHFNKRPDVARGGSIISQSGAGKRAIFGVSPNAFEA